MEEKQQEKQNTKQVKKYWVPQESSSQTKKRTSYNAGASKKNFASDKKVVKKSNDKNQKEIT